MATTTKASAAATTEAPPAAPETSGGKPPAAPSKAALAKAAKAAKAAAVAAGEAVEVEEGGDKKSRVQLASVLHIHISQARVATHLKHCLGDEQLVGELKTLRDAHVTAVASNTPTKAEEIEKEITERTKNRVRVSSETPISVAVIWDGAVKELLRHGMEEALKENKRIVEVSHLHSGGADALQYFPMYNKCESWKGYSETLEEELKKERAAANKAAKDAREQKKGAEEGKPAASKAAPKEADAESEDEGSHKSMFFTYVENALKEVKRDAHFKPMRVSNRVREYLSAIISEGIARQAMLARIIVQRVMGVRTMNAGHVKAVVDMLLADDARTADQIMAVTAQVDEKLQRYHDHQQSEKDKKIKELDGAAQQDLNNKRDELAAARKLKQIETAGRRAREAALKLQSLTAAA